MPVSPPWDDKIWVFNHINSDWKQISHYQTVAGTASLTAYQDWVAGQDHAAIRKLIDSVNYLITAFAYLLDENTGYFPNTDFTMLYYLETFAGCDMDAILNAMLAAKYEDLQQFIGIEDAYRSALWQQPFNAEFYAALARGFMP